MHEEQLDVTILLPCYNEGEALSSVINDIRAAMEDSNYTYEILVVDDNSKDRSAEIAAELGCRVIRHSINKGSGGSRKTGILAAKGKIIAMLDADGTYTASDIPKMLALFPQYDQVNGARTSEEGTLPFLRYPAKWIIRMIASILAGRLIPDLNTGLKAFKRDIMLQYLWSIPNGFSCVSSMTLAFMCNGYSVAYIPTAYHRRIGASKFHPVGDTYRYVLTVFRLITYFNPLKIFFPAAVFLIIFGVAKSLYDFFFVIRRLQLSDIIILISGVVIGFQGLLADLIVALSKRQAIFKMDDPD